MKKHQNRENPQIDTETTTITYFERLTQTFKQPLDEKILNKPKILSQNPSKMMMMMIRLVSRKQSNLLPGSDSIVHQDMIN